jgi:hypothetical protein
MASARTTAVSARRVVASSRRRPPLPRLVHSHTDAGAGTLRELARHIADALRAGRMRLFTGAGFSNDTLDPDGEPVPTGHQLRQELWDLSFPREPPDGSTLSDLFEHALRNHPGAVARLLERRLRIDPRSLRARHRLWFALPWRRVYTLNVDDLEMAVARRFELPRPIAAVSALGRGRRRARRGLEVIHLNGSIADGLHGITFSTLQYGDRLARRCAFYEQLVLDLRRHPFLIVGTQLGEAPLWQHVQLLAKRRGWPRRSPGSWLVARRLDRARHSLLRELAIEWIPMSARDFATKILALLPPDLRSVRSR